MYNASLILEVYKARLRKTVTAGRPGFSRTNRSSIARSAYIIILLSSWRCPAGEKDGENEMNTRKKKKNDDLNGWFT